MEIKYLEGHQGSNWKFSVNGVIMYIWNSFKRSIISLDNFAHLNDRIQEYGAFYCVQADVDDVSFRHSNDMNNLGASLLIFVLFFL